MPNEGTKEARAHESDAPISLDQREPPYTCKLTGEPIEADPIRGGALS